MAARWRGVHHVTYGWLYNNGGGGGGNGVNERRGTETGGRAWMAIVGEVNQL